MPGYRPTPLVALPELAAELGVAAVFVKDESERLGLPAFKILGASWAVNRALSLRDGYDTPAESLAELRQRIDSASLTLVTATDGNHGHALARVAALLGLEARIYVPRGTAAKTVATIASEGAQVIPTDLIYDDVIHAAADSTSGRSDELLVQDTAWQGYEDIPQWVVDGYGTLFYEIASQLSERAIHLVAVPTGVGSLLLAALQHYRDPALPAATGDPRRGTGHGCLRHEPVWRLAGLSASTPPRRPSWPGSTEAPSPPSPGPPSATDWTWG
jgi:diaminopropionate ammonia-lyase